MYNPNFECHMWMCLCGENGIVQLIRFDSTATEKSEEIYKQELKKLETSWLCFLLLYLLYTVEIFSNPATYFSPDSSDIYIWR